MSPTDAAAAAAAAAAPSAAALPPRPPHATTMPFVSWQCVEGMVVLRCQVFPALQAVVNAIATASCVADW